MAMGMGQGLGRSGIPLIGESTPPFDWQWREIVLTNGGEGQWVGYSLGGDTLPNPAFGSISQEPTPVTSLLALYDDTNSAVVLAVFSGEWEAQLAGLKVSLGGFVLESFEVEVISGNTWVRFSDMPGDWEVGEDYQVLFS